MTSSSKRKKRYGRFPPYPFETLRNCYVTVFGGVSAELQVNQIGINNVALESNTGLDPKADQVALGILGKGRTRPYFMERLYQVVGLDGRTPDAYVLSPLGEAVFSAKLDLGRRPFDSLQQGQLIVLSGVLASSREDRKEWRQDLLAKALRELNILKKDA